MDDEIKSFLLVMVFIILILLSIGWSAGREAKEQYEQGYKDACADFYQGKLKYDLITNPDGTREWKRVEQ